MAKYHVNDDGVPGVCRAKKRPCKFGGPDGTKNHYESMDEAKVASEKFLAKKHAPTMRSMKKAHVPESYGPTHDLSALDSEARANVFVFEAMKEGALLGSPDRKDYYGYGAPRVNAQLDEKLVAMGAIPPRSKNSGYGGTFERQVSVKALEDRGYSVEFIPGSMEYENTEHFDGTFEPNNTVAHLIARAVVHSPDGARLEVPVVSHEEFMELSSKALEIAGRYNQLRAQGDITMNVVKNQVSELREENATLRRRLRRIEASKRNGDDLYEDDI